MMYLLPLLNEWWEKGSVSREKAPPYRRKIFKNIWDTFSSYRQVLVLSGLRRVGKTTIIHQLIDEHLRKGIDPKRIFYFSFDEKVEDPTRLLNEYSKMTKIDWRHEEIFIFLDEVHKLPGWSSKVKLLYDTLPKSKILISGSASVTVEKEASKNLAGRHFCFEVPPLTLQEFAELYFGENIEDYEIHRGRLEMIFQDYIRKPFPELVKWTDLTKVNEYIRTLVVRKVISLDIPSSFKDANPSLLSTLTEIFMREVGAILNYTSLSRDLGVGKLNLMTHVKLLEYAKIVRVVKNYRPSVRAESRKLAKVYPFHPSLSLCFHPELSKGQILEALVAGALGVERHWREGRREVDFIFRDTPVEVKDAEEVGREELKDLLWFLRRYGAREAAVVYGGEEKIEEQEGKRIIFYPVSKLLYNFSLPV